MPHTCRWSLSLAALVAATVALAGGSALAQLNNEALVCPDADPAVAATEFARATSLAVRGTMPTPEEYALVQDAGELPEALLDQWLASDGFADQVVRQHRALLWNNVGNVNLVNASFSLRREPGSLVYWRLNTAIRYRGDQVPCLDEPATFTDTGAIATTPVGEADLEGYVMVAPYWAPDTAIKVCAFDAQEATYGLTGVFCGSLAGRDDASCGCGPNMQWCRYGSTHLPVVRAMGADVDLRVRKMVTDGAPYTELFSGQSAFVNGPLVHYLKHQTGVFANVRFDPLSVDPAKLPDLTFDDADTWVEIGLDGHHAGVMTSPAYLLRFQTDRARANRFYEAFLCQPFTPPSGGIPVGEEEESLPHPDLQERAGCKYCHALLEPAAAYWGRWAEGGAAFLAPEVFPQAREDCIQCASYGSQCSEDCNRFYLTKAFSLEEQMYLGQLDAYVFRRDEHAVNVEVGPELLVNKTIVDGRLPRCVASRTAEWLLGRPAHEDETEWIEGLAADFVMSGFDYADLVKAIVTHETYGRVR